MATKSIKVVPGWELRNPKRAGGWHVPAIRVGDLVFMSGVCGVHPGTKTLGASVEEQVRLIFWHIDDILKHHGASLKDVVHMSMYFTDRPRQWPILDRVRRELFPDSPPCSTGVGVTELDLGAALEIDATAAVPAARRSRRAKTAKRRASARRRSA